MLSNTVYRLSYKIYRFFHKIYIHCPKIYRFSHKLYKHSHKVYILSHKISLGVTLTWGLNHNQVEFVFVECHEFVLHFLELSILKIIQN